MLSFYCIQIPCATPNWRIFLLKISHTFKKNAFFRSDFFFYKAECIEREVCARYLTLPHVTSRYLTLPHITSRYLTLPHVTSRYLTLPHVTSHYLTLPHVTSRYLTLPHVTSIPQAVQLGSQGVNMLASYSEQGYNMVNEKMGKKSVGYGNYSNPSGNRLVQSSDIDTKHAPHSTHVCTAHVCVMKTTNRSIINIKTNHFQLLRWWWWWWWVPRHLLQ